MGATIPTWVEWNNRKEVTKPTSGTRNAVVFNTATQNFETVLLGDAATKSVGTGATDLILGSDARLSDPRTPTAHTHPFSAITSTPTDLAGYGIGDAYTKTQTNSLLTGKADLVNGLVPSSQLPSYVDDVLEYATITAFPSLGESGKIYVAADTNLTYRWSGSAYAALDPSLALGETALTAYRGDRGKVAYDHTSLLNNPHAVTAAQVGLSNVNNTSDANKPISTATQGALDGKEPTITAGTTAQYWRGDKTWQPFNALDATTTRAANAIYAGPTSGANAAPSFRPLVAADIPTLAAYLAKAGDTMTGALTIATGTTLATKRQIWARADGTEFGNVQDGGQGAGPGLGFESKGHAFLKTPSGYNLYLNNTIFTGNHASVDIAQFQSNGGTKVAAIRPSGNLVFYVSTLGPVILSSDGNYYRLSMTGSTLTPVNVGTTAPA